MLKTALLALIAVVVAGCGRAPAEPPARQAVTLVISGDTAGWITPCGCTSNQSGGLPRRGTFLAGLRGKSTVVYADAGGAIHGSSSYDRLKLEAIMAGEKAMGVAAHNIGRTEAALGAGALRELCRQGQPLLSANVGDDAGQPIARPLRIVAVDGRRVAFVGVLSPRFAAPGMQVADPRTAILAAIGAAKGAYDALIVLAYLPREELESLAAALPEADAIVGGPTGQPIAPRMVGPVLLASATSKGKFVAVIDLPASGPAAGRIVQLDASYADDPAQRKNLEDYLAALDRRDFPPEQTGLSPILPAAAPADYRVAGSESCAACHAAQSSVWRQTGHARAWQTLAARHFEVDPECMQCHTTGYGLPGGFATRAATPGRVSVGCESCHGPSAAHAADPHRHTPFRAADQCTQCHDRENSPKFDFAAYWGKIHHGPATPPAGGA